MEQGPFQHEKMGVGEAQELACQRKASRAMLPRTALCSEVLGSGELVVGRWYSWTMTKTWSPCLGCMAQGGRIRGSAHYLEGGVDSLLVLCQKSEWTHQGPCRQQGKIDGLRKGEKQCVKPRAGDADLWKIWEVAHVKAHRTKKEKEIMTKIERFVTEGNEKADELAKAVAMPDEGFTASVRAVTMKQERERKCT